ncbi:MAG TPA: c-type cytochrome [Burkholderiales bacterium]|nr:c-type cytochrome [Burkholderiales bacterium]
MQAPGKGRWAWLAALFVSSFAFSQGERLSQCTACHGPDGNSVTQGVPSLAGQPQLFLENQMILFREELRRSPVMTPILAGMKDAEIVALAEHFSKLKARPVAQSPSDREVARKGEALAKKLRCGVCHTANFQGQKQMPRLAGQREDYLVSEMLAYRDGKRSGGDTIMAAALYGVKDEEIRALAHYLSRLP